MSSEREFYIKCVPYMDKMRSMQTDMHRFFLQHMKRCHQNVFVPSCDECQMAVIAIRICETDIRRTEQARDYIDTLTM